MRKIGILGGTFNPPHNGHIHAARQAQLALGLDGIVLMPDNIPPHKVLPDGSANTQQRLEMTRLAAQEIPGAEVSDLELRRGGRSYTVDTLTELTRQNPDTEYHFIMGTDMVLTLDKWYRPEEICRLCALAIVARDERDRAAIAEAVRKYRADWDARIALVDCPALPMSSTALRGSKDAMAAMVPEPVLAYIREHRLYGWNK
ncbi:MAG: nicotinate-nucleotide adenylyltransferase [Eubacteriales bacterium]|nr:nicotinate-nucleotide adenylyltransferase [Eubacteriales bacterium]